MKFSTESAGWVEKYVMNYRVSSFEIDPSRRLRLSMLLKLTQEVAGRHFDGMGLSYEALREEGMVYLVTREAIQIHRMPAYGETLRIETWFKENRGAQYIREVKILSGEDTAVEIDTAWVLTDAVSHRILRPSAFRHEVPQLNECLGVKANKIEMPGLMEKAGCREIRWSDIDCNGHMNNAVYADIVLDFLPDDFKGKAIREFRIAFISEILLGEELTIEYGKASEGDLIYSGSAGGRKCFDAQIRVG